MKWKKSLIDLVLLPMIGIVLVLAFWWFISANVSKNLPNPVQTWETTKLYVLEPFAYRGVMDQGILRFTWLSLQLVAQGYLIGLAIGTPLGFILGLSPTFMKTFDPLFQVLRPVSPLAWLPLGMVLFQPFGGEAPKWAAMFTIGMCAMWPTVLNTAQGVRAIPQDYLNVAKVLNLSRSKVLFKILIPAVLPNMFTGFRLSLGIAWLAIVAAEMLTGTPGIGSFLWDGYNSLIYPNIILSIIVIGVVGFILDRIMSVVQAYAQYLLDLPTLIRKLASRFRKEPTASLKSNAVPAPTTSH